MSILSDIADAVVAGINEAELSQSVTAERTFLPVFDLEDMQDLHVTVVPRGVTTLQVDAVTTSMSTRSTSPCRRSSTPSATRKSTRCWGSSRNWLTCSGSSD